MIPREMDQFNLTMMGHDILDYVLFTWPPLPIARIAKVMLQHDAMMIRGDVSDGTALGPSDFPDAIQRLTTYTRRTGRTGSIRSMTFR